MKYKCIVADPPWTYNNKKTGGTMKSGSAAKYPTMTLEEICALPIREIAAKDCCLFLWTTTPLLMEAMEVWKAWGFKYKTKIYWEKPEEFFNLIEPIVPGPKIELFARDRRHGWDAWGNEVESDIELEAKDV